MSVYDLAVDKGRNLLAAMKAHPDLPTPLSTPSRWTRLQDLQTHGWRRDSDHEVNMYQRFTSDEQMSALMSVLGIPPGMDNNVPVFWDHRVSTGPEDSLFDQTSASHYQLFNVDHGTIFALDITSPVSVCEKDLITGIPPDRPVLHHWSDVTFLQWQELATGDQIHQLKCIIHRKIANDVTKSVMREALQSRGGAERATRTLSVQQKRSRVERYTEKDGKDFLALLGSPNGYGTAFMLAQHKAQLGRKTVKSITVHTEGNENYMLVLDLS